MQQQQQQADKGQEQELLLRLLRLHPFRESCSSLAEIADHYYALCHQGQDDASATRTSRSHPNATTHAHALQAYAYAEQGLAALSFQIEQASEVILNDLFGTVETSLEGLERETDHLKACLVSKTKY